MSEITQDSVLDKLRTRGYWRIELRPTKFKEDQYSVSECKKLIDTNQVRLRGWYFPHYSTRHGDFFNAQNHVVGYVDWREHCEVFKMFRSGQFVYYLDFWEDWIDYPPYGYNKVADGQKQPNGKEVIMTLYTVTEIFLFASRLATTDFPDKDMFVSIEMNDCQNRGLFMGSHDRLPLTQFYQCKIPKIQINKTIPLQELLTDYAKLALDVTFEIFDSFNWDYLDETKKSFKLEQEKFLLRS